MFNASFRQFFLLLGFACIAGRAHAIVSTTDAARLAGAGQSFLDGVARLDITRTDGTFGCSGSLLAGGAYVLTAAHCVSGDTGAATTNSISVSFRGGSVTSSSTSYTVAAGWNGSLAAGNDLALVRLSTPIIGITGYSLYASSAQGSTIVLAGYGYTGTGTSGAVSGTFGTLYYGFNQYDNATNTFNGTTFNSTYLYDFDNVSGPGIRPTNTFGSTGLGATEALIASGDSGGPSLMQVDGQWYLVGVHSFDSCFARTCPVNSSFGEVAGDIAVNTQIEWLTASMMAVAVPEPAGGAMFLAGLGLLGIRQRARRARSPA